MVSVRGFDPTEAIIRGTVNRGEDVVEGLQSISRIPDDAFRLQFDTCGECTIDARIILVDGGTMDLQKPVAY